MTEFTKEEMMAQLKARIRDVIEKHWASHVNGDYSEYDILLRDTLEKIGWFDRKIDSATLLVLFSVELRTEGTWGNEGDRKPDVAAYISPYLSVVKEGSTPSVDWDQFQPCDCDGGEILNISTARL